jgi:hypothetical protein
MRGWLGRVAVACAVVGIGGFGAAATRAAAAGGNAAINDCQTHGELTRTYTVAQLKQAIKVMPASVKQYGDCYDVIEGAIANHSRTGTAGSSSGSSGGSFLPTPVIVILVVLILAAVTFGAIAIRRRRGDDGAGGDPDGPGDPSP